MKVQFLYAEETTVLQRRKKGERVEQLPSFLFCFIRSFFPSISTKTNFFIVITKREENGEGHNIVSYLVALKVKLHFSYTCTFKRNVLTLLILALCRTRVS